MGDFVPHTAAECAQDTAKFVEAARRCVAEGLEATSELDIRSAAAWEEYYWAKAVRSLMLFFTADFADYCPCRSAWGLPFWRGLPPGFWPSDEPQREPWITP